MRTVRIWLDLTLVTTKTKTATMYKPISKIDISIEICFIKLDYNGMKMYMKYNVEECINKDFEANFIVTMKYLKIKFH